MSDELDAAVRDAATGDPDALRVLYAKLSPQVIGYASVRGARDPEALTNDVFVRVLPRIREIEGGWSGLRAFVFAVVHGQVVDELRRRARHPETQPYDADQDPRSAASAEDEALDGLGRNGVLALLGLLPEDQRDVITLRVLGDLTISEVATAIGRSEPAVKKLQAKALRALRALLNTDGHHTGSRERAE